MSELAGSSGIVGMQAQLGRAQQHLRCQPPAVRHRRCDGVRPPGTVARIAAVAASGRQARCLWRVHLSLSQHVAALHLGPLRASLSLSCNCVRLQDYPRVKVLLVKVLLVVGAWQGRRLHVPTAVLHLFEVFMVVPMVRLCARVSTASYLPGWPLW